MMFAKLIVPIRHAQVYIRDPSLDEPPEIDETGVYWVTSSCIAVTCAEGDDDHTEITIMSDDDPSMPTDRPLVDMNLPTPSHRMAIDAAEELAFFWLRVGNASTRVRIWTDGSRYTTWLWIVLG